MGRRAKWLSAFKKAFKSPPISSHTSLNRDDYKVQSPLSEKLSLLPQQNHVEEKRNWCVGLPSTHEHLEESPKNSSKDSMHIAYGDVVTQNGEQSKHALSVAVATAAAEAVVRLTGAVHTNFHDWNPAEEWAAVKIQSAFRAYLARRAFRALKALVRLQALARGLTVRRQSAWAMRCMQALARVQTRVRARRDKIARDSEAIQQKLWEKRQRENHAKKSMTDASIREDWDDSSELAEVMETKRTNRMEAAIKRERALAYAYSNKQWRTDPKEASSIASTYNDYEQDNPHWGWSWLEHWMAAVPWEKGALENRGYEDLSEKETDDAISMPILVDLPARLNASSIRRHPLPPAKRHASPSAKKASLPQTLQQVPPSAPNISPTVRVNPASPHSRRVTDGNPSPSSMPRGISASIISSSRSVASDCYNLEDESMVSSPERSSYMLPAKVNRIRSRPHSKPKQNYGTPARDYMAPNKKHLSRPLSQYQPKCPSLRGGFTPIKTARSSISLESSSVGTHFENWYGRQPFR